MVGGVNGDGRWGKIERSVVWEYEPATLSRVSSDPFCLSHTQ